MSHAEMLNEVISKAIQFGATRKQELLDDIFSKGKVILEAIEMNDKRVQPDYVRNYQKSSIVFFRHLRLTSLNGNVVPNMGITFLVRFDYNQRYMIISPSVCNGDNFSKKAGRDQAAKNYSLGKFYTFDLDKFTSSGMSVVDFFMDEMYKDDLDIKLTVEQSIKKMVKFAYNKEYFMRCV